MADIQPFQHLIWLGFIWVGVASYEGCRSREGGGGWEGVFDLRG